MEPSISPTQSQSPDRSYRRSVRWAAAIIIVLLSFALTEVLAYALGVRRLSSFRSEWKAAALNEADAAKFMAGPTFDPDLGWDSSPRARNGLSDVTYWAQSYGDSFTLGSEVEEEDTWQHQFQDLTGQAIVNLGVGGYGLDQAVLKFEKYGNDYATKVAILVLYAHEYRRLVSYESRYYFPDSPTFLYAFKPIFVGNGESWVPRPLPCRDAACLVDVLRNPNAELRGFLERHDYWYQANNAKPLFGFPYSWNLARMLLNRRGPHDYFFVNDDCLPLAQYLIGRFQAHCAKIGVRPLCLIIYGPYDFKQLSLSGKRWDEPIREFLATRQIAVIDSARYILDRGFTAAKIQALSAPDGHFNREGNRLIAQALADYYRPTTGPGPAP